MPSVLDDWQPPAGVYVVNVEVGEPPSPADRERWFQVASLADLESGLLDGLLTDVEATRGYHDGQSQGGGLALLTAGVATGAVLRAFDGHPVPLLHPERTWVEISEWGNAEAVRVTEAAFVPPTLPALRGVLHGLLDGFYQALHQRTRFPVVALWAQLASGIAQTLLHTGQPEAQSIAFMQALFNGDATLRRAQPHIGWVEHEGIARAYATRRVCCFNYRGTGGHYCGSLCPTVPLEERERTALTLLGRE